MVVVVMVSLVAFGFGIGLGLVAVIARGFLRKDMQRTLHLTVWQLLSLKLDRRMEHDHVPEHQVKEESGSYTES